MEMAADLTGGDPEHGRSVIRSYGCGSCHTIPGVTGADALVAPSLDGFANRMFVGGVVKNTPENLIRWIESPRHIDPRTAMPEMGVSERDARDIAGYLYTLQ
jgi:cytochrome c2